MKTEFGFLEKLKHKYDLRKIGDDCAVLPKDSKTDMVVTTDLLVEDIDFRLSWTTAELLGHKALAVSLSDIAAMGAKPVWSIISVGVPETIWKSDFLDKFYEGYTKLAKKFDVELVGGDISKTPEKIVIDSIAAGEVGKGKAVLRSGAQAGDLIFVTGALGGAAAGLRLLEAGENLENYVHKNLILRQVAPNPQTVTGELIGRNQIASAMIDLSDGLSSDLRHICEASQTGAKIFVEKIPIQREIHKLKLPRKEILSLALDGGEDFELLFTVNPKKNFQIENEFKNHQISCIGEITANVEIIELISDENSAILEPKGFQHFC